MRRGRGGKGGEASPSTSLPIFGTAQQPAVIAQQSLLGSPGSVQQSLMGADSSVDQVRCLMEDLMAMPHDVIFVLDDGTEVGASRAIVGARSAPFKKMLFGAMKEGAEERVKLPDMSSNCLHGIIEWIYTGQLTKLVERIAPPPPPPQPISFGSSQSSWGGICLTPTEVLGTPVTAKEDAPHNAKADEALVATLCEILATSEQYAMGGLKQLCSAQLLRRATAANVASVLQCADLHGAQKLKDGCLQFIAVQRHSVHANGGLQALSKELLIEAFLKTGADGCM